MQPLDVSRDSPGLEQDSNEQHVEELERLSTPQPEEEEAEEPDIAEPEPGLKPSLLEEELSHPPQSEEYESDNDEQAKLEVRPVQVGEHIREETEQHEEDQQPMSQDEASEIEAILTPEPPEGSTEGKVREQSTEHEGESPGHEHEMPDGEQEMTSSVQDAGTSQAEQEHEMPMDLDAEERDVSIEAEANIPGASNTTFRVPVTLPRLNNILHVGKRKVSDSESIDEREKKRSREESLPATPREEDRGL